VRAGRFRQDLFFRIDVLRVEVPPLRERRADVPVLARHFAERLLGDGGGVSFAPEAIRRLLAFDWPGNARELQSAIQRAVARQGTFIRSVETGTRLAAAGGDSPERLDVLLRHHGGDVQLVARSLGISARTVQRRMARFGLRSQSYRRKPARVEPDPEAPQDDWEAAT
jgi:transcriptional regulator with GAF, ATPase, and Fis domain